MTKGEGERGTTGLGDYSASWRAAVSTIRLADICQERGASSFWLSLAVPVADFQLTKTEKIGEAKQAMPLAYRQLQGRLRRAHDHSFRTDIASLRAWSR